MPLSDDKLGPIKEDVLDAYNLFITCFHEKDNNSVDKYRQSKFTDHIIGPVSESDLKYLIQQKLQISPFGITAVAKEGVSIKPWVDPMSPAQTHTTSSNSSNSLVSSSKNFKIMTNIPFSSQESKKIIITNVNEKSIVRILPDDAHLYDIMIHRCDKASIYLIGTVKSVSIERCRNCSIIVGGVLSVTRCVHFRGSNLSVASRLFSITNSTDVNVNLHTTSHPLLMSQCRRITFGPINFNFLNYSDILTTAGLPLKPTVMFAKPLREIGLENRAFSGLFCFQFLEATFTSSFLRSVR